MQTPAFQVPNGDRWVTNCFQNQYGSWKKVYCKVLFSQCLYHAALSLQQEKNKERKTEWCYFHSEKADEHKYELQSQIITKEYLECGQSQESVHAKAVAPLYHTSAGRFKHKHTHFASMMPAMPIHLLPNELEVFSYVLANESSTKF